MKKIFIYNDFGISELSLNELNKCMTTIFKHEKTVSIEFINGSEIQSGKLMNQKTKPSSILLCLGGGFDIGYLKSLDIQGCNEIIKFINAGGNYLGICAGAYFATDLIEFDLEGPLEVKGNRLLKFFNGKAVGPINRNFEYGNDRNALAIKVDINKDYLSSEDNKEFYVYLNGGCFFVSYSNNESNDFKCIGKYDIRQKNENTNTIMNCLDQYAILECTIGKGKCLLSGVHFEFDVGQNLSLNEEVKYILNEEFKKNEYFLMKILLAKVFNF
jgi:glutamine amidotransferase-like uncharacterized protein